MSSGPGGQRIVPNPPNGSVMVARPQQVQPPQMLANGQLVRTSAGGMIMGGHRGGPMPTQGNMVQPIIRPGMSMVSYLYKMSLQFT